jgi:hypothetical protein
MGILCVVDQMDFNLLKRPQVQLRRKRGEGLGPAGFPAYLRTFAGIGIGLPQMPDQSHVEGGNYRKS